jgi:hypothetical protein
LRWGAASLATAAQNNKSEIVAWASPLLANGAAAAEPLVQKGGTALITVLCDNLPTGGVWALGVREAVQHDLQGSGAAIITATIAALPKGASAIVGALPGWIDQGSAWLAKVAANPSL